MDKENQTTEGIIYNLIKVVGGVHIAVGIALDYGAAQGWYARNFMGGYVTESFYENGEYVCEVGCAELGCETDDRIDKGEGATFGEVVESFWKVGEKTDKQTIYTTEE